MKKQYKVGLALLVAVVIVGLGGMFAYRKAQSMYYNVLNEIRLGRESEEEALNESIYWSRRGVNESNALFQAWAQRGSGYEFDYSWVEQTGDAPLIAHAFGALDGKTYTNSLEAFEQNYALGHRVFEVDFELTDDTYTMVATHYKEQWYEANKVSTDQPFTEELFRRVAAQNGYTPLNYKEIVDLMAQYPDIYLITDTKYEQQPEIALEFSQLVLYAQSTEPEVLDRIIPQIYNMEMLRSIMDIYPFRSVIFTLYTINWYTDSVRLFCQNSGVGFVAVSAARINEELITAMEEDGVYLAVHTINSAEKAQNYLDQGVDMIYTDSLNPQNFTAH